MTKNNDLPYIDNPEILSAEFRRLYENRINKKITDDVTRKSFNLKEKEYILQKTNNHCHVCGEKIDISNFQADHVIPYSLGGKNDIDNYLASCKFCNNYRWNYLPDEIKWILKIGVWVKTQIEFETNIGKSISQEFLKYEKIREHRRKNKREPLNLKISDYPIREKVDYSLFQKKRNK